MNKRPSLTNVIPIELIKDASPQPEQRNSRNKSVPPKTNDDSKPKPIRPISVERPRAISPAPPVRNIHQGQPKVIPKIRKLPTKPQFQSKSAVSHSQPSVLNTRATRMSASAVLTRSDVYAIQKAIKLSDKNPVSRHAPTSTDDIRNLHSRLRDCYKRESTFEMTFQSRRKDDSTKSRDFAKSRETMKSVDSGIFSISGDYDQNVVEEWKPEWERSKAGSAPGEIRRIKGICFTDDDRVAITEEKNCRIQIFDKKRGQSFTIVQDPFPGRRMQLGGICQLPYRNFLAATDQNSVIYLEPRAGGLCKWKSFDKQIHLHGIAVNSREHLFLTDLEKKRVYTYDISGKRILTFKPDDFLRPDYVAVSEEYSMVFVSDSEQGCVYMFNMDGELLNKIGRQGNEQEKLIYPLGVCCRPNGKLIVADRGQHRLSTYDFRARCYEHLLTRDDLLYSPTCIATDGDKYLAVAEENHDFKVDEYKLKMFYKCGRCTTKYDLNIRSKSMY